MKFTSPLFKRLTGPRAADRGLLSVGVLVDIIRSPSAGGHVKCWERLAEAARGEPVDLTVYFLGERGEIVPLSENVRLRSLKPVLSTRLIPFLKQNIDHADLAPFHPRLWWNLKSHDVIHTTGAHFSLSRTARLFAITHRRPLVNSIHTDTPGYARVYCRDVLGRIPGLKRLSGKLRDGWRIQDWVAGRMRRRLHRHLKVCDWVLASRSSDAEGSSGGDRPRRFSVLRRGIDKEHFHPARRDRARLEERFGIGRDRIVLLFVGRVDPSKNVLTLARAARRLLDHGCPIQILLAGEGARSEEIHRTLGQRATLPGRLSYEDLAWTYASSDLFVFPSELEIAPNVVLEAKASGLPVVLSTRGGSAGLLRWPGRDGLLIPNGSPRRWAEAVESLIVDPDRRASMGALARAHMEMEWPSWKQVLREDLMPVWREVANKKNAECGMRNCEAANSSLRPSGASRKSQVDRRPAGAMRNAHCDFRLKPASGALPPPACPWFPRRSTV